MRKLSLSILLLCFALVGVAQKNPHGFSKEKDCTLCHNTENWTDISSGFNHDTTGFVLQGMHNNIKCTDCHKTLVFSKTKSNCFDCHVDIHSGTLGLDCNRCHDNQSWIVDNVKEIHDMSRFPLFGAHRATDCASCHKSASNYLFEPLGAECFDCHQTEYQATTTPNHVQSGYSTNCIDCHKIEAFGWTSSDINHDFFPLVKGHAVNDCASCHTSGISTPISPDCSSCHQNDYLSTSNPSHQTLGFETDCKSCHTIDPGWKPAQYREHDAVSFPIYSGNHRGEWNNCATCHTQPNNYSLFTCIDCHEHNASRTNDQHKGISGYNYSSPSCYACHPRGTSEGSFNHSLTGFPLLGSHAAIDCASCHASGYSGTSALCSDCHLSEYNATSNPKHASISISTQCDECHDNGPGWEPAKFPQHNQRYALNGAHAVIASDCYLCHQGNFNSTSNTCFACHSNDYNSTTNPNHASSNFSTNCKDCHSENAWSPSTFDHDNQYFPIYSGRHSGRWNNCADCHTNPSNFSVYSCITCHEHNQTSMQSAHNGVGGYVYNSANCFSCHPRGEAGD